MTATDATCKTLLLWQLFVTTRSQYFVKCTETNIPIPYLVYASPTPGRKSWQSIKKQKNHRRKLMQEKNNPTEG